MYCLGINGGFRQGYQDVSAVLVKDGRVVAAVEEERLSRIKFSAGKLPYYAILEVLKIEKITINDIDRIAFHGSTWNNFSNKLEQYFLSQFGFCPPVSYYHHHDCHAASAYYASNSEKALVVTYDGSGDGISFQVAIAKKDTIVPIYRAERPNSLGIFYSLITQYCGFSRDSDEYKLMGLSSYGNRNAYDFSWLLNVIDGQLKINETFLVKVAPLQPSTHRDEMLFNTEFIKKMGRDKRLASNKIDHFYQDIAASAQAHFERCLLNLIEYYITKTNIRKLCLSGGAALNCVANQKVMNANCVDDIYIQPASSDAGVSLGAAWLASIENGINPLPTESTFLGGSFSIDETEEILQLCKVVYQRIENPSKLAAQYIAENKVIGWFQGNMEFGPRALGNRSILANPCHKEMQKIVNKKIKLREGFRPFCPSVLEEDMAIYFDGRQTKAPYMTITYNATEYAKQNIPSVIHVDGTARIQTVNREQNEKYYLLLQELKQLTGHGVVLNTSFNLSHEPIVYSPRDALATFFSSGLDALFIGDFLLEK